MNKLQIIKYNYQSVADKRDNRTNTGYAICLDTQRDLYYTDTGNFLKKQDDNMILYSFDLSNVDYQNVLNLFKDLDDEKSYEYLDNGSVSATRNVPEIVRKELDSIGRQYLILYLSAMKFQEVQQNFLNTLKESQTKIKDSFSAIRRQKVSDISKNKDKNKDNEQSSLSSDTYRIFDSIR